MITVERFHPALKTVDLVFSSKGVKVQQLGKMIICNLCSHFTLSGLCRRELRLPKGMSCKDFGTTLEKFCADPKDFVSERQITEMATFFGMKGTELKKVKLMAAREESARL